MQHIAPDDRINLFGIYHIRNTRNDAIYVGSTVKSFRVRWHQHRYDLRVGKHGCAHLQNAWNKYGESEFAFEIVEIVSDARLVLDREQSHLDSRKENYPKDATYNILWTAGSRAGHKPNYTAEFRANKAILAKQLSSNPDVIKRRAATLSRTLQSLDQKQKKSEISKARMSDPVMKQRILDAARHGRIKTWKGFVSPDGTVYKNVRNLAEFCRTHKLIDSCMRAVASGKSKHHKGWASC